METESPPPFAKFLLAMTKSITQLLQHYIIDMIG